MDANLSNRQLTFLTLWAANMSAVNELGWKWPGFSYSDAEFDRMEKLSLPIDRATFAKFLIINAVIFIAIAGAVIAGPFFAILLWMFPNPADTSALKFALLLAGTAFLTIGLGLRVSMPLAASLAAGKAFRAKLVESPGDAALLRKAWWQINRMTLIMCGVLVPGIMVLVIYDIDAGPLVATLKWITTAVTLGAMMQAIRRRHPPAPN